MSDLSQVPLLVLEKVRNKWWDITSPGDKRIHRMCAMCWHVDEVATVYFDQCRECCPIHVECAQVLDMYAPNWRDCRDEFLEKIITEIDRRAACE